VHPVALTCGHKYCATCLEYLPSKDSKTLDKRKVECPMCRTESYANIPNNGEKKLVNTPLVRPRNIKLLEEFDASIGRDGKTFIPLEHTGMIGYGASEDMTLSSWTSIIIGPQDSPIGQVIYNLIIDVPSNYPSVPPKIRFQSPKIAMSCVDSQGWVDVTKIELVDISLANNEGMVEHGLGKKYSWDATHNIADVLIAIREMMYLRSVSTPSGNCASGNYC